MLESKTLKENKKRLSIITDIMLLIPIVIATVLVIKTVKIPVLESDSTEVLSLASSNNSTIELENEEYIEKINNEFGINVMYGKKVVPFANRLDAVAQFDENIVNNNLKIIYKALKKYPMETFNMSISNQNPIYIMIVDHFENNNIALASRNNLDEYRVYISNTEKLERALHHEIYHVLEYYMSKENSNLYNNWNELNPKDFNYEKDTSKLTKDYVYIKEKSDEKDEKINLNNEYYFVTKYSKSSEKEDRAEIFAELMIMQYPQSYVTKGQKIRNKIDYIFKNINSNITEGNFYCTKFLTS